MILFFYYFYLTKYIDFIENIGRLCLAGWAGTPSIDCLIITRQPASSYLITNPFRGYGLFFILIDNVKSTIMPESPNLKEETKEL